MSSDVHNNSFDATTLRPLDVHFNVTEESLNLSLSGEWLFVPSTASPDSTAYYIVFSTIFLLGILGNSLLLFIFARHKTMRTVPNTYIMSLAVADLVTTVCCASAPLLPSWLCSVLHLPLQTVMCVTSWTMLALGVERYYAIVKPFSSFSSAYSTLITVSSIWLLSVLFSITNLYLFPPLSKTCVLMFNPSSFAQSYTVIEFVLLYLIPLTVIGYFYILLAINLYSSGNFLTKGDHKMGQVPPHIKARKRIALMVLVLVAMYAIFFFPFNYFSLRLYFNSDFTLYWDSATNIIYCVGCLHNAFNPVILYLFSDSFRQHFNLYFNFFTCRSKFPDKTTHVCCDCSQCCRKSSLKHTLSSPSSTKA